MTSADGDIGDARRAATAFGSRECPDADLGALALVVSELVTNAARHTSGWWRLTVRGEGRRLDVEVEDRSSAVPAPRTPRFDGRGGHGLNIVGALAGPLEVVPGPHGKTVRARWVAGRQTSARPLPAPESHGTSPLIGYEP